MYLDLHIVQILLVMFLTGLFGYIVQGVISYKYTKPPKPINVRRDLPELFAPPRITSMTIKPGDIKYEKIDRVLTRAEGGCEIRPGYTELMQDEDYELLSKGKWPIFCLECVEGFPHDLCSLHTEQLRLMTCHSSDPNASPVETESHDPPSLNT